MGGSTERRNEIEIVFLLQSHRIPDPRRPFVLAARPLHLMSLDLRPSGPERGEGRRVGEGRAELHGRLRELRPACLGIWPWPDRCRRPAEDNQNRVDLERHRRTTLVAHCYYIEPKTVHPAYIIVC